MAVVKVMVTSVDKDVEILEPSDIVGGLRMVQPLGKQFVSSLIYINMVCHLLFLIYTCYCLYLSLTINEVYLRMVVSAKLQ